MTDPIENLTDEEKALVEGASARYMRAMHAMQSGVAMSETTDPSSTTPKHLRVGVNSAMISDRALTYLLIAKGVFTYAEFTEALAKEAEAEVKNYEVRLGERYGMKITLG